MDLAPSMKIRWRDPSGLVVTTGLQTRKQQLLPPPGGRRQARTGPFVGAGRELLGERPQPLTQQNHGHVECLTQKQMQPLLNEVAVAVPAVRASWIYRGRGSVEGPPQAAFRC